MIQYLEGDALLGGGNRVIAHVCNDAGGWGAGFVLSLSRKWPGPEKHYRKAHQEGRIKLGFVQLVGVSKSVMVANMVAQTMDMTPVRVKYDHLDECLRKVESLVFTLNMSTKVPWEVHMPRIGVGLGGGSWDMIEPLLFKRLDSQGIVVKVFDLPT